MPARGPSLGGQPGRRSGARRPRLCYTSRHNAARDALRDGGLATPFPDARVTIEQSIAEHVPRADVPLDFGDGEPTADNVSFTAIYLANGKPKHANVLAVPGYAAAQQRDDEKAVQGAVALMHGCDFVPISFEAPTGRPGLTFVRHIEALWRRRAMRPEGHRPSREDLSAFTSGLMQVVAIPIAAMGTSARRYTRMPSPARGAGAGGMAASRATARAAAVGVAVVATTSPARRGRVAALPCPTPAPTRTVP